LYSYTRTNKAACQSDTAALISKTRKLHFHRATLLLHLHITHYPRYTFAKNAMLSDVISA
jgi:hypothetical protein